MAYFVPNLNPSSATYPRVVNGGALSAVGSKNLSMASIGSVTATKDVKTHYTEIFDNHAKAQNNLLKQLNDIFGKSIPMDGNRHVSLTDFIKDVCVDSDQANDAYKFYGCQIIEQINQLGDYILKARALLEQATTDFSQWLIDQLDILDGFSKEMNETFGFRYIYDLNEDVWTLYEDDYADNTHTQVQNIKPKTYDELRATEVQAYSIREYQKDPVFTKKTIEVFNELNLLDRLKYIKLYYDIDSGRTDALFPNDKVSGIPTVKEASSADVIAAIEPFFMGYLIDRDGPVNAVASYLEVKSAALIEKINLESKKIKSFNIYLNFIQRALDVLNASQSGAKDNEKDDKGEIKTHNQHRLPDGAMTALNYLCAGNMYNLYEEDNRTYLVFQSRRKGKGDFCFLVPTDNSGMRFLVGDNGTEQNAEGVAFRGNNCCDNYALDEEGVYIATFRETQNAIDIKENSDANAIYHYYDESAKKAAKSCLKNFKLPPLLECEKIDPGSVRKYTVFQIPDEVTTEAVSSWQKAFQDKLSFIQTAMGTVNSDIKVFRSKIDTLNTLSNTFRNRTYTAYMKVASNLKK